jgi:hypothetical protein
VAGKFSAIDFHRAAGVRERTNEIAARYPRSLQCSDVELPGAGPRLFRVHTNVPWLCENALAEALTTRDFSEVAVFGQLRAHIRSQLVSLEISSLTSG